MKKKHEKPVKLDMDFDEALQRLSKVNKSKVDRNVRVTGKRKKDSSH